MYPSPNNLPLNSTERNLFAKLKTKEIVHGNLSPNYIYCFICVFCFRKACSSKQKVSSAWKDLNQTGRILRWISTSVCRCLIHKQQRRKTPGKIWISWMDQPLVKVVGALDAWWSTVMVQLTNKLYCAALKYNATMMHTALHCTLWCSQTAIWMKPQCTRVHYNALLSPPSLP